MADFPASHVGLPEAISYFGEGIIYNTKVCANAYGASMDMIFKKIIGV